MHMVVQLLLSGEGEVAFAALISALEGVGRRGGSAPGLCRFESLESGDRLERLQQRSKTAWSNQSTNWKIKFIFRKMRQRDKQHVVSSCGIVILN